jgi:hypothetical protein
MAMPHVPPQTLQVAHTHSTLTDTLQDNETNTAGHGNHMLSAARTSFPPCTAGAAHPHGQVIKCMHDCCKCSERVQPCMPQVLLPQ